MDQYRHSPFDEEMLDAMIVFNENKPPSEKFTLIDARILSLVHSYTYANQTFFASNQYLAEKCFTTAPTIQKSINKLYAHDLIDKNVSCANGNKKRTLSYNEAGAKAFKKANTKIKPDNYA